MVDFDAVYEKLLRPAIIDSGMEPLRADEEFAGGIIHKPMFERLVLCEYAIADLTTANANVFYELGLRHGVRPWSTVVVFASGTRLPFDVAPMRGFPYTLARGGRPARLKKTRAALAERLREARKAILDSPVFQLVEDMRPQEIDRLKTDAFRERFEFASGVKRRLAAARARGADAVRAVARELESACSFEDTEAGVIIDLFLSFRAVRAWDEMVALVAKMSRPLAETTMVQEQLALALNRARCSEEAERVVRAVLERHGPSSETYGILGRIYKDRWEAAVQRGEGVLARGLLAKAIKAYLNGFEADWRDAYPGINALTLMELREPPDPRRLEILPVVRYAVSRRMDAGTPDYWDYATLLELAVLARDREAAADAHENAVAAIREVWEPETTARNLRLIREARERRGDAQAWATEIEEDLARLAGNSPV